MTLSGPRPRRVESAAEHRAVATRLEVLAAHVRDDSSRRQFTETVRLLRQHADALERRRRERSA